MKNKKILFIFNTNASWVNRDYEILSEHFHVTKCKMSIKHYFIVETYKDVFKSDILFLWFGSLTFLPLIIIGKILKKKIIVVAGGYDVARSEVLNHGTFSKSLIHQAMGKLVFYLTDRILAVSESTRQEVGRNVGIDLSKVHTIYHGFSLPLSFLRPWDTRENSVVMIANACEHRYTVKGIDRLVSLAKTMPEVKFYLVGKLSETVIEKIQRENVDNLNMLGFVKFNSEEYCKVLMNSKFVAQFSRYESFGAAVIEGAIFGCVPLVADCYALPEVIGDRPGSIFNFDEPMEDVAKKVRKLMQSSFNSSETSKVYYEAFSFKNREFNLVNSIQEMCNG